MGWIYILIAGVFEIVWAVSLKLSGGLTRPWPLVIMVAGLGVSMVFLALSLKRLPLGTAYAVWTGIGAVGTVAVGILALGESAQPTRLLCIALILAGIVGLKLVG